MLKFNTLGWRKEDETSPNKILLKRHYGVDGFFRYLALRSLYGKKLSSVMMCPWVKFLIFVSSMEWCLKSPPCMVRVDCYDGFLCPPFYGAYKVCPFMVHFLLLIFLFHW